MSKAVIIIFYLWLFGDLDSLYIPLIIVFFFFKFKFGTSFARYYSQFRLWLDIVKKKLVLLLYYLCTIESNKPKINQRILKKKKRIRMKVTVQ